MKHQKSENVRLSEKTMKKRSIRSELDENKIVLMKIIRFESKLDLVRVSEDVEI
jgi:hypothetical protein